MVVMRTVHTSVKHRRDRFPCLLIDGHMISFCSVEDMLNTDHPRTSHDSDLLLFRFDLLIILYKNQRLQNKPLSQIGLIHCQLTADASLFALQSHDVTTSLICAFSYSPMCLMASIFDPHDVIQLNCRSFPYIAQIIAGFDSNASTETLTHSQLIRPVVVRLRNGC